MYYDKYFFTYRSQLDNQQYKVVISENAETTLTEVKADISPFKVNHPEISNKFQPVLGSGCIMNLLSDVSCKFLNMYTPDMFKYKIKHFRGEQLIGSWYMESELLSTPFDQIDNYTVTFKGVDFNILERINYINADGTLITGIKTTWDVITTILTKLGLDFNNIYVASSTTIDGKALGTGENIFHLLSSIQTNYINEDEESETCRTVLEGILQPLGMFITQIEGNLYLTDLNTINSYTATYKRYNATTYAYIDDVVINHNLGDLSSLKVNGANFDIINGINKQVVCYSPYLKPLIDWEAKSDSFTDLIGSTPKGAGLYTWDEFSYTTADKFNKHSTAEFCKAESTAGSTIGDQKFYLKSVPLTTYSTAWNKDNRNFSLKYQLPYIIPSAGYYLKIDMSAYFRTKNDWENTTETGKAIYCGQIWLRLRINDKVYVKFGTSLGWRTQNEVADGYQLDFYNIVDLRYNGSTPVNIYGKINDTEITAKNQKIFADKSITTKPILIPLNSGFSGGILEFDIYNFLASGWDETSKQADATTTNATKDCRINRLKLTIADANGNEITDNDIEYVGTLNSQFKNEGQKIELIHGTNVRKVSNSRAAFLTKDSSNNYQYIVNCTRAGVSSYLEHLLIRSIKSNYINASYKLTCSIDYVSNLIGFITYSNFLSGKKFMVAGSEIDYQLGEIQLTLYEFTNDYLTIE